MSDAARRAAGRSGDAGRALLERVRAGELDRPRLVLAARLGSRAARLALGEPPPGLCWPELAVEDEPEGLTERVLAAKDQEPLVRAALVAVVLGERTLPAARPGVPSAEDADHLERVWYLPSGAVAGPIEAWLSAALTDAAPGERMRIEPLDADGAARELAGTGWAQGAGLVWTGAVLDRLGVPSAEVSRALVASTLLGAGTTVEGRSVRDLIGGVAELKDGTYVVLPVRREIRGPRLLGYDARVERRATEDLGHDLDAAERGELLMRRAQARGRLGDVAGAEADWLAAAALEPGRTGPRWGHGLLRWQQGDLRGAAGLLADAASFVDDPQADLARLERARVLIALGKHADAVAEAERVLARPRPPVDPAIDDEACAPWRVHDRMYRSALIVRSSARRLAGRPDLALGDATAAAEMEGPHHWSLLERARVHEALGDVRSMRADAEAALRLVPELSAALALRAQARALANDLAGALEDLRAAVARRPDEPTHREELGRLLLALGRPEEGQRELDEARRLAPWRFLEDGSSSR